VAILSLYLMGCIAAMAQHARDARPAARRLRSRSRRSVVASAFIVWLLWHATWQEFAVQGVVLAAAAACRAPPSQLRCPSPADIADGRFDPP
jgi:hypothetical protein